MLDHLKLGPKFTLLLTIVFVLGILLSGVTLWATIQHEAEEDITMRAELLMQTMNSVRNYTSNHIQPLLEKRLLTESEFIQETVPAFSARTVFDQFRNRPEYSSFFYKEATPNPTNPQDLADSFEADLFEKFHRQPELTALAGYHEIAGKQMYYTARPLVMREVSCLQCHSTPAAAPKSQLITYGDKTGYGWRMNEVIAAQTIYVPADEVLEHGWHNMTLVMSIFSGIFAIAILLINRLLKRTVIQPIRQLTTIARHLGSGSLAPEQVKEFETPTIVKVAQRQDEPGQLARTFQQMAHEVAEREQNLNQAVEDRTAQLAERTREAQQASQAKSQFLANMSHELRTPLNIILGFSQLMTRNRSLDAAQQGYLTTINRSGEHLLNLINSVLDLAKIEAGKITLNETEVDFNSILDWLYPVFQFKAQTKNIQFRIERAPDLPERICTDEGKLRQVLVNLLGNAIKFTQTGCVILRVTPGTTQDTLQFEVEDTGVGMAPDELKQLFQPFVQTDAGRNAQEGTGLGLTIAQQFVRLMGGTLTAHSQVGVGTTFRFSIQAPFMDAKSMKAKSKNVELTNTKPTQPFQQITGLVPGQPTHRILIVDDSPENRQLLVELLKPIGFDVREARSGQEAVSVSQQWLPHLIWMDLRMPGLDGYEATQQIKATTTPVPIVIALTGGAFEDDRRVDMSTGNSEGTGWDDFVRKPFRAETIFEKMAAHLGVRYRYATESANTSDAQDQLQNKLLTPADLAVDLGMMPIEWIEQLHQATTRVNAKLILQLIDQIPSEHSHLIHTLTTLVNQFRFTDLMVLTQSHLEKPTSDSA
jgi:signal transduction histidine kinase/DNA-binding response OmpR family regulator